MRMETDSERERLKFVEFDFASLPSGRCRSRVVLERQQGMFFEGEAEGLGSPTGQLRCAAEASVHALANAVEGRMSFELLGVKSVRAFDATVVIVSLTCHDDSPQRVVGSYLAEEDAVRGAALAVLNATNRLLGNIIYAR